MKNANTPDSFKTRRQLANDFVFNVSSTPEWAIILELGSQTQNTLLDSRTPNHHSARSGWQLGVTPYHHLIGLFIINLTVKEIITTDSLLVPNRCSAVTNFMEFLLITSSLRQWASSNTCHGQETSAKVQKHVNFFRWLAVNWDLPSLIDAEKTLDNKGNTYVLRPLL